MNKKQVIGFLSVAEIGIACLAMHFFLRHGLPVGNSNEEQALYIVNNSMLWHLSWVYLECRSFLIRFILLFLIHLHRQSGYSAYRPSLGFDWHHPGYLGRISTELYLARYCFRR